jgi:flagellar biosynthesis/type III secretory pathway chaperone
MKSATTQLVDLLEQTHALYERLLDRLNQEKNVMLGSQARKLMRLTIEKQELFAQLAMLEKQRQTACNRIACELQIPVRQLNLKKISQYVGTTDAQRILTMRDALNNLIPKVRKANDESRSLMQHCLNLVQGSLSFLQHVINPPPVYGASGGIADTSRSGHLLSGQV